MLDILWNAAVQQSYKEGTQDLNFPQGELVLPKVLTIDFSETSANEDIVHLQIQLFKEFEIHGLQLSTRSSHSISHCRVW